MCVIYRRNQVASAFADQPLDVVDDPARRSGRQQNLVAAPVESGAADSDRDDVPAREMESR
jgi:hypothetical protein